MSQIKKVFMLNQCYINKDGSMQNTFLGIFSNAKLATEHWEIVIESPSFKDCGKKLISEHNLDELEPVINTQARYNYQMPKE